MQNEKIVVLTHNYPEREDDSSGIWIQQLWEGSQAQVLVVPRTILGFLCFFFSYNTWTKIYKGEHVLAYWTYPAGCIALLSGKRFTVVPVGLDIFQLKKNSFLRWCCGIIFRRATNIVFISRYTRQIFNEELYPGKYHWKTKYIPMPPVVGQ